MRKGRRYALVEQLLGWGEAEVQGLLPEAFLNECVRLGVTLLGTERRDELTLEIDFPLRQRELVRRAGEGSGCELRWGERHGLGVWWLRRRQRWGLAAGAVGVALLLFVSSLYIWEIQVTENPTDVPDEAILSALEEAGVGIGSYWPGLSIDMLRSRALRELPRLSYLTVNIHGSRAEVLVRGAEEKPEISDGREKMDVRAAKSGVITSLRVLEGEGQCRVGETVTEGQVLVSAKRGCALGGERLVHARAEVMARTWYEKTAVVPLRCRIRTEGGTEGRIWGLQLGKSSVFFARDSRISQTRCDTMYSAGFLSRKSTFALPVAVLCREQRGAILTESEWDEGEAQDWAESALTAWLRREVGEDGAVTELHFTAARQGDVLVVTLRGECLERIDKETPYPN